MYKIYIHICICVRYVERAKGSSSGEEKGAKSGIEARREAASKRTYSAFV